jgi:ceramide glucosyltransferase
MAWSQPQTVLNYATVTLPEILLWLALAGLVSCTGFLLLAVAAAIRFRRRQRRSAVDGAWPPVTLLKPLCGLEPNLEANLESFFRQDYPSFEIIFGTRDRNDPALEVVRALQSRYPRVAVKLVCSGEPVRPNAKVCSLEKMCAAASFDHLVISDSDVQVTPDYLRDVVGPLLDPSVGMVTCLYRGVPTGGIWSRLEALGMSVEMTSGVLVAEMLEGMRFALGPTMATRRDVLERVGGVAPLADFCADDYLLGNQIYRSGYTVVLSPFVIDHVVLNRSFEASLSHQVRWMKSTRFSRRKGHIGSALTFAMPFGLLGMAAGIALGNPLLATALLAWAVLNRIILSAAVGWAVVGDSRALRYCWLYPVRDLLGFFLWCASFMGRSIVWRGTRYRLEPGGKMARLGVSAKEKPPSETIAVDNLA